MKKFLCIILAIVLAVSFTACGKESPEKAANNALKAIKTLNISGIEKYFGELHLENYDIDEMSVEGIKVLKKITSKMSWEILETVEEEDSAVVSVRLTTVDVTPIITEIAAEFLGDALSSLLGDEMTEEEVKQKTIEIVEEELSEGDIKMMTNDIDLKLTRTEDGWKVEFDILSMIGID